MVTLDDVAKLARVSRMTASNALRGKSVVKASTAERVRQAAKTLNYQPNLAARQLSSGRTNVIGFSTVELDHSPFSAALAAVVSDMALQRGYQTLIQQTRYSTDYESSMLSAISTQFTDGTILCAPAIGTETIAEVNREYPLVVFDGDTATSGDIDTVSSPCEEGARAAVGHLLDQGCRRVLILGAHWLPPKELATATLSDGKRLRGASLAYADHGMDLPRDLVHRCEWKIQDAYAATSGLIDRGLEFDGMFALSDVIAIGAMRALLDHGLRIPQDVAVVGFDGLLESSYLHPRLTTVVINPHDVATRCLDLLIHHIDHRDDHRASSCTVPFSLQVRSSSLRR